ncbi:hypothetical protein QP027_01475 [Corynebacterium breve]|uniref:Uncharacterized protein n=1 Tax=Corynebacterium breve TaxID=3049799 RepID=A0ABY8VEK7_9CORY|nr:hypothetical protein [Corynebacterium breve]WIM68096.1 hypothetical protein QP027_01475 [Corynebacterium breve]
MSGLRRTLTIAAASVALVFSAPSVATASELSSNIEGETSILQLFGGPYHTRFACEYDKQGTPLAQVSSVKDDCVRLAGPYYFYIPVIGKFIK